MMSPYLDAIRNAELVCRFGRVTGISGQSIESAGPETAIGELCEIDVPEQGKVLAEVVGLKPGHVVLMPFGDLRGIAAGNKVMVKGAGAEITIGEDLLGRVIDAFGLPLDGGEVTRSGAKRLLHAKPANPLRRPRIDSVLETGVRVIDSLFPLGRGQRMGIFAGSGVGKSTLLGMMARNVQADINVIALIGERGREVREFVENSLGTEGMRRSIVVVATSDQPALMRARAAYVATAIAEHFRESGKHVLLMMDSITRFAMARREIGLAAGEPPTSRGYTPSVFGEIPALCERCGTAESGGTITAMYTVLVEGDDFNEPISDIVRATLDGHIMLSRDLAHEGIFPAVDVLQSVSRLAYKLVDSEENALMSDIFDLHATYARNRQMVEIGAYREGTNPAIDRAIRLVPMVRTRLTQSISESTSRQAAISELKRIVEKELT